MDEKIKELRNEYIRLGFKREKIRRMHQRREISFTAYWLRICYIDCQMRETMRRITREYQRKTTCVGRITKLKPTTPSSGMPPGAPEGCNSVEMEEIMDNVTRVPEKVSGVQGGVEVMSSCAVSSFDIDAEGKPINMVGLPQKLPCKLMASFERGTVSISAHGTGVMMTVKMDDILRVIEEACGKRS